METQQGSTQRNHDEMNNLFQQSAERLKQRNEFHLLPKYQQMQRLHNLSDDERKEFFTFEYTVNRLRKVEGLTEEQQI